MKGIPNKNKLDTQTKKMPANNHNRKCGVNDF